MKKFITAVFLLATLNVCAQFDPPVYQPTQYESLAARLAILIPNDTLLTTYAGLGIDNARQIAKKNGSIYHYSPSQGRWIKIIDASSNVLDSAFYNPASGALTFRRSDGSLIEIPDTQFKSVNIYNSNGTLLSNRVLNGSGKSLVFNNLSAFTVSASNSIILNSPISTTIGGSSNLTIGSASGAANINGSSGINLYSYSGALKLEVRSGSGSPGKYLSVNPESANAADDQYVSFNQLPIKAPIYSNDAVKSKFLRTTTDGTFELSDPTSIYSTDGTISAPFRTVTVNSGSELHFTGTSTVSGGRTASNSFRFNTIIDPINIRTSAGQLSTGLRMQPDIIRMETNNQLGDYMTKAAEFVAAPGMAYVRAETPTGVPSRDVLSFVVDADNHAYKFEKNAQPEGRLATLDTFGLFDSRAVRGKFLAQHGKVVAEEEVNTYIHTMSPDGGFDGMIVSTQRNLDNTRDQVNILAYNSTSGTGSTNDININGKVIRITPSDNISNSNLIEFDNTTSVPRMRIGGTSVSDDVGLNSIITLNNIKTKDSLIGKSVLTDALTVNGNVGIGTTTPGAKLDVNGGVLINGVLYTSGDGSPEGAVTAPRGSWYSDTINGLPYFKTTSGGNTGWKQITLNP